MSNKLMIGYWRYILMVPPFLWEKQISKMRKKIESDFGFMTKEHRMVHNCVVKELPDLGEPLSPEFVVNTLDLPQAQVADILDHLEMNKVLVRNSDGAVVWAYPVTVEPTPHHLTFSTGERIFGA
ncbi:hypothetical protein ACFL9T_14645 [Thermodesulfobacteriota bacterium]